MANARNKAIFLNMFYMYIYVQIDLPHGESWAIYWTYSTCASSTSAMVLSMFYISVFILSLYG